MVAIPVTRSISIDSDELVETATRSGGAGGQHVNKTATKDTLLFDVAHSPSLTEERRATILEKLANRIDNEGVLQIQSQTARSQWQNRELALARFQTLLAEALRPTKPRKKTRPSRTAVEKRLSSKHNLSQKKQERRKPALHE